MISMIAAVGKNLELGYGGDLIWHLKDDMKSFRSLTLGKTIVMGRKTFESLGGLLPKRRHIVITRDSGFSHENVEVCHSIEEALEIIKNTDDEIFIIGGGTVYKQFLPHCDRMYLTEINENAKNADTYFPDFNKDDFDRKVLQAIEQDGISAEIALYERKKNAIPEKPLKLGILGGLGPMASAYFYEMITEHTLAEKDQDHIDILLSSRATTPDRTAFILGKSDENPLPIMIKDAKYLESCNVSAIVIPCNTAHYFIEEIRRSVSVPMPSIITETVSHIKKAGRKKAGIMATEGTVSANSYQLECEKQGIEWVIPSEKAQGDITDLIYNYVKKGIPADEEKFGSVVKELTNQGCDVIILGCTELSVINRQLGKHDRLFADSLEVLAYTAIKLCGHTPTGFGPDFDI